MRAGTLPRYGGGYFSLGKNIYPQPPRGIVHNEQVELIHGEDAAGFCGELKLALGLIPGHDQVSKLHIHKAFRLFHLLRSVDAHTQLLQAMFNQAHYLAVTGNGLSPFAVLILVGGHHIDQQHFTTQAGRVDPKITKVKHNGYFLSLTLKQRSIAPGQRTTKLFADVIINHKLAPEVSHAKRF